MPTLHFYYVEIWCVPIAYGKVGTLTNLRESCNMARKPPKRPTIEFGAEVRVGTYVRRSTDEEHQPYSIDAQDVRLDSYIDSQPGWHHVTRFSDDASGATINRPGLKKAIAAANAGVIDALLVYRVDRFSRNLRDMVTLLDELDSVGVVFRSATEPFDTATPMGRMLVQMLGMFAQFERDTIIDRTIAGMERKAAKGMWKGGKTPFGYALDPVTHTLVVDERESVIVRKIFSEYGRSRFGSRAIANLLNSQGHRTTSGRPWSGRQLTRMLANRVYLGELTFRSNTVTETHEPIVDVETWGLVQRVLETRGESAAHRAASGSDYLVTGRLRCPRCGQSMVGTRATGRSRTYRYYTCWSRSRYSTAECDQPRLDADSVDQAVVDALASFYGRQRTLIADAVEANRRQHAAREEDHRSELMTVEAELGHAQQSVDRYLTAFERGSLDEEILGDRVGELRSTIGQLKIRQRDLLRILSAGPQEPAPAELDDVADRIRDVIHTGTHNETKALIEELVARVMITAPDRLVPVFRIPVNDVVDGEESAGRGAQMVPEGTVRAPRQLG